MTKPSKVTSTTSPRQCNFWHKAQRNDLGQTALVQHWPNNCNKTTKNAKTDRTQFSPLSSTP